MEDLKHQLEVLDECEAIVDQAIESIDGRTVFLRSMLVSAEAALAAEQSATA